MTLEDVMPSEVGQPQKDKYRMILLSGSSESNAETASRMVVRQALGEGK